MPTPPAPLPDHLGDAFSRSAGLAAGLTARRLRAKDLERPFHGVRQRPVASAEERPDGAPLALDRAVRAAVLRRAHAYREVMAEHAFFVGRSAGVLHGLPMEHRDDLEVGVAAPARAPRGRGIRGIKVQPALVHVREEHGVRLSSPASTWAMLGRELSVRELVIAGDAVVRVPRDEMGRPRPDLQLATVEQLALAAGAGRRRGAPRLREALPLIRVGSASPLETEYRLDAAAAGLPEPELDVAIRDRAGRLLGITEVVYREHRTLVEIEGDHHRTDRRQWDRDIEKHAAYAAAGWEVARLTSRHIRGTRPRGVDMVRGILLRQGWTPSSS